MKARLAFIIITLSLVAAIVAIGGYASYQRLNELRWTTLGLLGIIAGIGLLSVRENWYVIELSRAYASQDQERSWLLKMLSRVMLVVNGASLYFTVLAVHRTVTGEPAPEWLSPFSAVVILAVLLTPVYIGRQLRRRREPRMEG